MAEKKTSILMLCIGRAMDHYSVLEAGRVAGRQAAFIKEWGDYLHDTGERPGTGRGFARWAHVSHQTAANRINEFRVLFPEDPTPARLAGYLETARRRRPEKVASGARTA
jgi:hypothetical protein